MLNTSHSNHRRLIFSLSKGFFNLNKLVLGSRSVYPNAYFSIAAVPEYSVINMPALSPTMEMGIITKWCKEPGATLGPGDVLCEVETDKATVAFEMQDEGVLAKILVPAGSSAVKVGMPVAVSVDDNESYEVFKKAEALGKIKFDPNQLIKSKIASSEKNSKIEASIISPSSTSKSISRTVSEQFLFSPAAKSIVEYMNIDARDLQGSGREGRITKADIILALRDGREFPKKSVKETAIKGSSIASDIVTANLAQSKSTSETPTITSISTSNMFVDVPANNIRKVIAKRLAQSKATIPHFYLSIECELDPALNLRKILAKKHDTKISVNDLVIRAAALALRDVPEANCQWSSHSNEIIYSNSIDISIAVATPTGLITPIIKRAIDRGLSDISSVVKDLAGRAKENKLKPEEFQGGTFTISNLGMFGIDEFSAVINLPQACILAVGSGSKSVLPGSFDSATGTRAPPRVATVMTAKLSCDRRVVDELIAAKFSKVFQSYIQKPELMLL